MISGGISIIGTPFTQPGTGMPKDPLKKAPIQAPKRVGFAGVLPGIEAALGDPQKINVPRLGKVQGIQGFGDEYFQSLLEESRKSLGRDFYGRGGIMEKSEEALAGRGMLGSTIESGERAMIGEDFGQRMASMISDINRMKTEERVKEAQESRRMQQERDLKQAGFDVDIGMKSADLAAAYKELGIRGALTEAAEESKYGLGIYEQEVIQEEIAADREAARRQNILDLITSPEVDMDQGQIDYIMDTLFSGTGGGGGYTGGGGGTNPITGQPLGPATGSKVDAMRQRLIAERRKPDIISEGMRRQFPGRFGPSPADRQRDELLNALLGI